MFSAAFAIALITATALAKPNKERIAVNHVESTKLVIEVSRHGARTSENIYPLTVDPADNFQVAYDLT